MRDVLVAVLALVGVLVGAFIQHVPAKSKERDGQFINLRNEASADDLRGVPAVAIDRSAGSIGSLTDAKARMAIYATEDVMAHLAAFENAGPFLSSPSGQTAFVALAAQMRSESGGVATQKNIWRRYYSARVPDGIERHTGAVPVHHAHLGSLRIEHLTKH